MLPATAARLPPAHHPTHLSLPHRHPPRRLSSPQLKPRLCLSTSCFAQHLQVDLPITPVKSHNLKVHATGDGGLEELQEERLEKRSSAVSVDSEEWDTGEYPFLCFTASNVQQTFI